MTPAYARLGMEIIENIVALMPEPKILYLLRNPVDRIWSELNIQLRRNAEYEPLSYKEIVKRKQIEIFEHLSHHENLSRWTTHVNSDQIFIGFFDQIKEKPKQLLHDIFTFSGVSHNNYSPRFRAGYYPPPVNHDHHSTIPDELEYELTQLMLPQIEEIHRTFSNN